MNVLGDSALNDLVASGIRIMREAMPADAFRAACCELGEIFYEADVKLGAARPRNYQLPRAIGFHTDHVSARFVAWHCITRDPAGGAMQLVDLCPAYESLSDEQRSALERVHVDDNAAWGGGTPIALCARANGVPRFHYVPWLNFHAPDSEARAALAGFHEAVADRSARAAVEIDLAPGQAVFVDNHRIAHGRAAIAADSPRHLKRYWMREPGHG